MVWKLEAERSGVAARGIVAGAVGLALVVESPRMFSPGV